MSDFELSFDHLALLLLPIFLFILWFFFKWSKKFKEPSLFFPDLSPLSDSKSLSFKKKYSNFPRLCLWMALSLFLIALLDPHYFTSKKNNPKKPDNLPKEGIAIYLIADESGSMMEEVNAKTADGSYKKMPKIELLKNVSIPFIEGRPQDLIGLIAFARAADVRAPLTLDHKSVIDEISLLHPSIDEKEGGTAIGYAVFKTVNLIIATKHFANDLVQKGEPAYNIKNAIIVLVTDGVQNVNPEDVNDPFRSMDVTEAAKYAKENHIRFYAINVDPSILTSELTPERNLMRRVTEMTGGQFYIADSSNSLSQIYEDINQIEKSDIKEFSPPKSDLPQFYNRVSLYPYFIMPGLLFLLLFVISETTYFKRVP